MLGHVDPLFGGIYLENGLYFEADPPADPVRYLSQTDALDAWVLHDRGLRDHPAPKPHQRLGPFAQRMLDRLSAERPSGWIPAGCALLDASSETRERIGRDMDEARHRARERNLVQRGSYTFRDASEPMLVCWIVAPDSQASHLLELLGGLVEDALDGPGPPRVLGLALTESSSRPYDALLVVEQKIWEGHRRAR